MHFSIIAVLLVWRIENGAMTFLEILSLITAFQLFQLGVILLSSRQGNQLSNRTLSLYMFSNALLICWFAFGSNLVQGIPIDTFFYFLLAPYLYLYVKSLTQSDFKRSFRELLHWIPAIIALSFGIWKPHEYRVLQIFLDLQIAIYLVFIFKMIIAYRKDIREHFSTVKQIDLAWLLFILLAFVAMWLTDVTGLIISQYNILNIVSISINFIFATLIVYRGLRHPKVLTGYKEAPKYSGSKITTEKSAEYAKTVTQFMSVKKPFLNPDLTIKELADQLSMPPKSLSQVINSKFRMNFFDFVNHYRVNEAKLIMLESKMKTILEILYEVGYNSKSAFNEAFKKETRMTPTEYRKLQQKSTLS